MKLALIALPILLLARSAHGEITIETVTVPMSVGCPAGMHSDGLIYETNPPQLDCLPPAPDAPTPTITLGAPYVAPLPSLSIVLGHNNYGEVIRAPDLPLSLALLFL